MNGQADVFYLRTPKLESPLGRFYFTSTQFAVSGMLCDACVNAITAAIEKVPGVKSVEVSLADERAIVVADEEGFDEAAIMAAVIETGCEATPADDASTSDASPSQQRAN